MCRHPSESLLCPTQPYPPAVPLWIAVAFNTYVYVKVWRLLHSSASATTAASSSGSAGGSGGLSLRDSQSQGQQSSSSSSGAETEVADADVPAAVLIQRLMRVREPEGKR